MHGCTPLAVTAYLLYLGSIHGLRLHNRGRHRHLYLVYYFPVYIIVEAGVVGVRPHFPPLTCPVSPPFVQPGRTLATTETVTKSVLHYKDDQTIELEPQEDPQAVVSHSLYRQRCFGR